MLDLGIVEQDTSGIEGFAKEHDIDFEVRKTDIGDVVFNIRKEKNPCAMCAKMRRGALNDIALEKGCNLVALGHNREDVLETFLLSLFFEARLNTFAPVTYLGRTGITVIRPLVFFRKRMLFPLRAGSGCRFCVQTALLRAIQSVKICACCFKTSGKSFPMSKRSL